MIPYHALVAGRAANETICRILLYSNILAVRVFEYICVVCMKSALIYMYYLNTILIRM